MFSANQLQTMFEMQDELNTVMGSPTWRTDNNNYALAARVELNEAIDHVGWKWWKKQNPNLVQAQIEIVDSWHFLMSHILLMYPTITKEHLSQHYAKIFEKAVPHLNNDDFAHLDLVHSIDLFLLDFSASYNPHILFFSVMCHKLGLTGEAFFKMYIAKNALNLFRQKHGDKQGTYIKQWFGQEDNVYLEHCLNTLDVNAADFVQQLNASLETQYAAVKAAVTH